MTFGPLKISPPFYTPFSITVFWFFVQYNSVLSGVNPNRTQLLLCDCLNQELVDPSAPTEFVTAILIPVSWSDSVSCQLSYETLPTMLNEERLYETIVRSNVWKPNEAPE